MRTSTSHVTERTCLCPNSLSPDFWHSGPDCESGKAHGESQTRAGGAQSSWAESRTASLGADGCLEVTGCPHDKSYKRTVCGPPPWFPNS